MYCESKAEIKSDLLFPPEFRTATAKELAAGKRFTVERTPQEYIAEFNKINHLKE